MRLLFPTAFVIAGMSVFASPAARAGDVVDPLLVPLVAAAAVELPAAPVDASLPAAPIAPDALDDLRGGTDISVNDSNNKTIITNTSDVDGNVDDNIALNTVSGGNMVGGGSFGNAAGLSTVIQNSGNNVLIQNSTVVSIQFAPTP